MRTFQAVLLAGVTAFSQAHPVPPARAEIIDAILATVDGEPITLFQVKQFQQQDIRARQAHEATQSELLDAVINDKIIEREVAAKGIIVQDAEVSAYIESIKQRNNIDDEKLNEALAAQGFTPESYRKQIRQDLQKQQLIAREIRGKVSVTPEEIERYYRAHLSEYATPDRVEVSHILLRLPEDATPDQVAAVMAKAEQVRGEIKGEDDFVAAAKRYSEDPSGADGGKLGWFKKGELLEPMEHAVAKLRVGQISEPVRTRLGVHILMVNDRESGGKEERSADMQEEMRTATRPCLTC